MGNTFSSDESEHETDVVEKDATPTTPDPEVTHHSRDQVQPAGLHKGKKKYLTPSGFQTSTFSTPEKHRIPSPTRESGDGSEETSPKPSASNPNLKEQPRAKWIHLPQTNIRLEKLPPIRDDNFALPKTEPTSPLVQVGATIDDDNVTNIDLNTTIF